MSKFKSTIAFAIILILSISMLGGCATKPAADSDAEKVYTATSPHKLYENSSYPGVTFNENSLVFIENMFKNGAVKIYSNEANSEYTVADESLKSTLGDKAQHYLSNDVIAAIRDDWQTESWEHLEGASFSSSQPQIVFSNESGDCELKFWLQAKFVGVTNGSSHMIFRIGDEIVETVQKQFNELPTSSSTRKTVDETIELFFEYLNKKDPEKLNTILATPVEDLQFDKGVTDKLREVNNLGHIGAFPEEWYANPYANRVVVARFTRLTKKDGGLFSTGSSTKEELRWEFYLVRESADSEWKVAAYGEG